MKYIPEKYEKQVLSIVIAVFIAVISMCILAVKVPETRFVSESMDFIETSNEKVVKFAGVTLASSLAISALPGDFATPLAESMADMNKYFVIILTALFIEKLILLYGIKYAFAVIVPIACGIFAVGTLLKNDILRSFSYKLCILGLAIALVIPCETKLVTAISSEFDGYVDETIEMSETGAGKINEQIQTDGDGTVFDRITEAFQTASEGITNLMEYFKNVIKRTFNSIAIMICETIVLPIATAYFFKWILKELFNIKIPDIKIPRKNDPVKEEAE